MVSGSKINGTNNIINSGPIQVELVANRILAIIPIIVVLNERMANRLIIPVVTINTLISLINLPHAIIILIRELRRGANRILAV